MGRIRGRVGGALLAIALFALALAGASLADHDADYSGTAETHFVVSGSPSCPAGTTAGGSITLQPGANGTFDGLITVTGYDGDSFNWAFTQLAEDTKDMAVVIVRGGNNAVVYTYDHQVDGLDDDDSGLTAPDGQDIVSIQFCLDVKGGADTGELIVRKVVQGSDVSPSSFSFSVDGSTTPFESDGENVVELVEGTYTVTEPSVPGFDTSYDNCSDIEVGPDVEGTPVCTITNTAVEEPGGGTLVVRKIVQGSNDSPSTFSFTIGESTTPFESDGQNVVELPDGTYTVTEPQANQNGFTTTYNNCTNVQVSGEQQSAPVCTITNSKGGTPPPPPPPPRVTPKLDVWVQKGATPQATLTGGTASIGYDVVVSNNGPNQANDVTFTDTAPAGVTFGAITSGPSQGTCSITPSTVSCNFGVVGHGVVVTLAFSATVAATGTYVNTACVQAAGNADTNTANNCDSASTLVVAPITPPTAAPTTPTPSSPKPKPKPQAKPKNVCVVLTISTRTLSAGSFTGVSVKVTKGGRAVPSTRVRFKGPGILKTVATNRSGIAVTKLRPGASGIVKVTLLNKKACSAKRIGVLGTFEPPVTG